MAEALTGNEVGASISIADAPLAQDHRLVLLPRNLAQLIAVCDERACRSCRIRNAKVA